VRLAVLSAVLLSAAWAAPPNDELQQLVQSGSLSDLRWPDFTRLQPDAARFYELNGYQLAWSRSGRATPQALALIHAIENAAIKGLDPEDYDGRLTYLGADTDWARFDVALTVSATRYISDLSSGKVNPEVFFLRSALRSEEMRPPGGSSRADDYRRRGWGFGLP